MCENKIFNKEKGLASTYADLRGIAERFYKNKKNGVEIVLREVISNAIHACLIEKEKRKNFSSEYTPKVLLINPSFIMLSLIFLFEPAYFLNFIFDTSKISEK